MIECLAKSRDTEKNKESFGVSYASFSRSFICNFPPLGLQMEENKWLDFYEPLLTQTSVWPTVRF